MERSKKINLHEILPSFSKEQPDLAKPLFQKKYEEKVIEIKRVTKVVKGGKRMSFRATVVIGDTKQKIGIGVGRADDAGSAIQKAIINGKKAFVNVPLTLKKSIPRSITFSYGASRVMLKPAPEGAGIIAGGAARCVLELSGIKNIVAKQLGANNILNNAKATIIALNLLNEKMQQNLMFKGYSQIMAKYALNNVLFF